MGIRSFKPLDGRFVAQLQNTRYDVALVAMLIDGFEGRIPEVFCQGLWKHCLFIISQSKLFSQAEQNDANSRSTLFCDRSQARHLRS